MWQAFSQCEFAELDNRGISICCLVGIYPRILCHMSFHSLYLLFSNFPLFTQLMLELNSFTLSWCWRCVDAFSYDQLRTVFFVAKMIHGVLLCIGSWCWKSSTVAQSLAEDDRGRNKAGKSILAGVVLAIQVRKMKLTTAQGRTVVLVVKRDRKKCVVLELVSLGGKHWTCLDALLCRTSGGFSFPKDLFIGPYR